MTGLAALACLAAAGCAGSAPGGFATTGDAAVDAGAASSPYEGPICCQVTHDFTDDLRWHDHRFGCEPDAGVSASNVPWVCNLAHPTPCDDPACVVGSTCQGFNGTGVVLPCDAGE